MSDSVPAGWKAEPLKNLAEVVSGGTPSRHVPEFWEGGTIPWVTPTDITGTGGRYISDSREHITELGLRSCSTKLLPGGSLLMTSRATLGEVRISVGGMCTNQGFKSLIPFKGVNNQFLFYQLGLNKERYKGLGTGSTFLEVNKRDTEQFMVLIAEDPEHQRRIADILSTVDEAIEQTEALIAKYQQIKSGLMHDLFTRGISKDGKLRPKREEAPQLYGQSELGWIPKEWEVKSLSAFTKYDITYGIVQAGPHIENGVPYIRTGDMSSGRLTRSELLCTSKAIAESYKRSEVRAGEIVCAIRATVGQVLQVPPDLEGANLTQGTARIAPNSETDALFLLWAIRAERTQKTIMASIKGTTFNEITLTDLRRLPLAAPAQIREQGLIGERLEECDKFIGTEVEYCAKLRRQKYGLMQDLLTGQVPVKVRGKT